MSASNGSPRVGVKTFARIFGSAIRLPTAPARHRRVIELPSPFAPRLIAGLAEFVPPALTLLRIAAIAWLIPAADAISCAAGSSGGCLTLAPALAGSAAAVGLHMAGAYYFGIPLWYGLLFPAGYTAGAVMAIESLRLRLSGRVTWKGRTYP
jgi:chlorobactene glucosyltransferase